MVRPWPASILLVPLGILPRPPVPLVGPLWLLLGDGQREVEEGFEDLGDVLALLTHHGADQLTPKQALNKRVLHLLSIHLQTDTNITYNLRKDLRFTSLISCLFNLNLFI